MKIVYPLETKKRELNGVLLLASKLIKNGHEVYIGPKRELNYQVDNIKPDVFIASNAGYSPDYQSLFSHLKKNNSTIFVVDTEGGVIIDEIYKKRHVAKMLKYCDTFFAWGERGKELVNEGTGYPLEKIIVSGAPWFDILTQKQYLNSLYQKETLIIEREYGKDFILYNSRFSGSNTFNENVKELIDNNYADNEYYRYSDQLFEFLNNSIGEIAKKFPNKKIIIRPHPSEGKEFYVQFFKQYNNIYVDDRFSVHPWISLSKLMFHNGCTTAIEAALMHKPVLAYLPIENSNYDIHLPNNTSEKFKTTEELFRRIHQLYNTDIEYLLSQQQTETLTQYIANTSLNSTNIITNKIIELNISKWKNRKSKDYEIMKLKNYILKNHLGLVKWISVKKYKKLESFQKYGIHKFPSLSKEEINNQLKLYVSSNKFDIIPLKNTKDCFKIVLNK